MNEPEECGSKQIDFFEMKYQQEIADQLTYLPGQAIQKKQTKNVPALFHERA